MHLKYLAEYFISKQQLISVLTATDTDASVYKEYIMRWQCLPPHGTRVSVNLIGRCYADRANNNNPTTGGTEKSLTGVVSVIGQEFEYDRNRLTRINVTNMQA